MANPQNLKPFTGVDDPRRMNGKPKGTKHKTTWIQELTADPEFDAILTTKDGVVEFKGAPFEAIVRAAIHRALYDTEKGLGYMEWLAKHGWPEPPKNDRTINIGVSIYGGNSNRPEAIIVQGYDSNSQDIHSQETD